MTKDAAYMIRNRATENAERLQIANQLEFWRAKCSGTTDVLRLASYRRIIKDLTEIAERFEASHAN